MGRDRRALPLPSPGGGPTPETPRRPAPRAPRRGGRPRAAAPWGPPPPPPPTSPPPTCPSPPPPPLPPPARPPRGGQAPGLARAEPTQGPCRNAGEIEFVFRPPRRNNVRVLLLMDVGGTMDPYFEPVSRLLTALHEDHGLREFQPYYFHNCIYDHVYKNARMTRAEALPTADLLRRLDAQWKVAVGAARGLAPAGLPGPPTPPHPPLPPRPP